MTTTKRPTGPRKRLLVSLRGLVGTATVVALLWSAFWGLLWWMPASLGVGWALLMTMPGVLRRIRSWGSGGGPGELMLGTEAPPSPCTIPPSDEEPDFRFRWDSPRDEGLEVSASGGGPPEGATTTAKAPQDTEPVRFLALHPARIVFDGLSPFWAYAFKPSESAEVFEDADLQAGDHGPLTFSSAAARDAIDSGVVLVVRPTGEGLRFDPPHQSALWRGRWRRFDFRVAVATERPVRLRGNVSFSVEGLLIAEVPFELLIGESPGEQTPATRSSTAKPYDAVFPSYSHRDKQIVERVERAYRALGLAYLRDVTTLRSGQKWRPELGRLIEQADLFQLFWSNAAAASEYVTEEWQAALRLIDEKKKPETFIRPVYWEEPMPAPPAPLGDTHFAYEPNLER